MRLRLGRQGAAIMAIAGALAAADAAAAPELVTMGDSIGASVQSGDANFLTQPRSFMNLVARKMDVPFPLPWVIGGPLSFVEDTVTRRRLLPWLPGRNLSESGADTFDLLFTRADARSADAIDDELDLMLFPRRGSQMEIVERLRPQTVICWIGANDVLGAALAFNRFDASQMTPVDEFESLYRETIDRLAALGRPVVVANIPDVTRIPFLADRAALLSLAGSDFGLAPGSRTSLIFVALAKLGLADGALLQDPEWVLDADELEAISERVEAFNEIIEREAEWAGFPMVDVNRLFRETDEQQPVIAGVTITAALLGGLFSLDGVHPSNLGHALLANAFIMALNDAYDMGIPLYSDAEIEEIALSDPFLDKDGDGRAVGRFPFGLIETLGPLLGVSGDPDDLDPSAPSALTLEGIEAELVEQGELEAAALIDDIAVGDAETARQRFLEIARRWTMGAVRRGR